jgi:hypothetical protein
MIFYVHQRNELIRIISSISNAVWHARTTTLVRLYTQFWSIESHKLLLIRRTEPKNIAIIPGERFDWRGTHR